MARDDVFSIQGKTFFVGTSAVIGFTAISGQINLTIKAITAGSSGLYVGGASMAVGLSAGIGTTNAMAGFLMASSDYLSLPLSGNIYFTSAGSTATVSVLPALSLFNAIGSTFVGGPG